MFTPGVLASLSDLERSVYDCIVENKERILQFTIKDLAAEAHVSTGTILRFCKKLGFDGYSHFKLRYKEYLQQDKIALADSSEIALKGLIYYTESSDFQSTIEKAVDMLKDSKRIIFAGIGSSGSLGRYGARYFSNIGRFSLYVEDPWQPVLQELTENTVAIVLSESGTTPQTIAIVNKLRECGSSLIAITNTGNSTIAKMADCVITYHVPEVIINNANITTQVPVVFILETLAKRLYTQ